MSETITIHQGDKEVFDFLMYDRANPRTALSTDDVTAAEFVAQIGNVTLTATLGSGISTAVVSSQLVVTVTLASAATDTIAVSDNGSYQLRLTRGSIGPDTVAEGTAKPVLKVEG